MKINMASIFSLQKVLLEIIFFVLFPGFFIYHTLLGLEYIPSFLGGFFGPISLLSFPFIFYFYLKKIIIRKIHLNKIDVLFILIMALTVFISIFNYVDGRLAFGKTTMLIWSLSGVLFNFIAYVLSRSISIKSIIFKKFIYLFLFAMLLIVMLNVGDAGIFYFREDSTNNEIVATYQGFARSIAVIALVAIVISKGLFIFCLVFFISFLALFMNGARTELVCFLFSSILVSFARFSIFKSFSLVAGFVLLIIVFLYGLSSVAYEQYVNNNRILEIFDLKNATSVQERNYLNQIAIRTILENPILGDYASYIKISGTSDIGTYAHNIFSAWVNLGVVGFSGYILMLLFVLYSIVINWKKIRAGDIEWNMVVAFSSFCIVAMAFGKDYTYLIFGLSVGFVARAISSSNYLLPRFITINSIQR